MKCLLCREFELPYKVGENKCRECPLSLLIDDKPVACVEIATLEYKSLHNVPLSDIAGFLMSLLVSLEELRGDK